jgi:hypothetical protein
MSSIQVTPAGNQLYEVEIHDPEGTTTQHTVTLGDALLDRVAIDDVPMRDVVVAAIEFLTARESRDALDREIDLTAVADRYEGFVEEVPARARVLAAGEPSHPVDEAERPTGDDRLLAEVEEEQARGDASTGRTGL